MKSSEPCRFETELEAYHLGQLPAATSDEVRDHIGTCADCARALEEIRRVLTLADGIEVVEPSMRFRRRMSAFLDGLRGPARDVPERVSDVPVFLLSYAAWKFRRSRGFRVLALSAAAHAALLLVLALVVLPRVERKEQELRLSYEPADREVEEGVMDPDPEADGEGSGLTWVEEELAHTPRRDTAEGGERPVDPFRDRPRSLPLNGTVLRTYPTDRVAAWMSGRVDDERKRELVRDVYGDERSLDAIGRALAHLARTQEPEGSWAPGEDASGYRTGVTGLALLAFLGDGHSVHRGDHRAVVARAADWLLSRQDPVEGLIRTEPRAGRDDDRPMYGHAIATYALVELYGLDFAHASARGRAQLRRTIHFAIAASEAAANDDGGWRYRPQEGPSDASVTLWQLLALQAAHDAGFPVPEQMVERAAGFLDSLTDDAGAQLYHRDRRETTAALNAGALAVARLLGTPEAVRRARTHLVVEARPTGDGARDPLLWFLATIALRREDDTRAGVWAGSVARILTVAQRSDGAWPTDLRYGTQGGAAFTTAMGALALQGAYREGG